MVKAILFDFDGVLVDSMKVGFEVYQEIAKRLNVAPFDTEEEFQHTHIKPYHDIYAEWGLSDDRARLASEIYFEMIDKLKEKIVAIPGIREILDQLAKKYRLAIASGTSRKHIEDRLKALGLAHYFEVVVGHEDIENQKPAPDLLHACLEKLRLDADEAVFVGDMVIDIQMGKAAGVKTVITCSHSWNHKDALQDAMPDVFIEKPEQLLGVLND
jgi:HAD superfamily hydrolase (TIGR01509 family)